jgi:hypothetical protein
VPYSHEISRFHTSEELSNYIEKYREMLLKAAEKGLGYFGFHRTVYGEDAS